MTITTIRIEDEDEGKLAIKVTSNRPLPEDFSEYTLAELLTTRIYEAINNILREDGFNENELS